MEALILAAGKGTRLLPITKNLPKPLIPLGGRPLLAHILDSLNGKVDTVSILIGYEAKQIQTVIDINDYEFEIQWLFQKEQLGTGHAVQQCKDFIRSDNFIMMFGDIYTSHKTLMEFLDRVSMENNGVFHFAAFPVNNPENYGCLEITNDKLVRIHEKSTKPASNYINAGIMSLPSSIFDALANTQKSSRGEFELPDAINMEIENKTKFKIFYIEDLWTDIGYPWHVLEANQHKMIETFQGRSIDTKFDHVKIEGFVKLGANVVLRDGCYIQGPVVIDDDAVIGPNCFIRPYTYIGKNVRIGNGVEIKNSIILENTAIGHLSYVGDSYIGKRCNFGAGTKVANLKLDKSEIKMKIKGQIVNTGRRKLGVIMGDNVNTGINVSLMPGIKIGEGVKIGAHTLVTSDISDHMLCYNSPSNVIIEKKLG
ncbi:MAG: bifunctional sugar-1-phosphate nucleotidylyltransferase/acetyltransferase [Candidatus Hodarchaeales archaeon]